MKLSIFSKWQTEPLCDDPQRGRRSADEETDLCADVD